MLRKNILKRDLEILKKSQIKRDFGVNFMLF